MNGWCLCDDVNCIINNGMQGQIKINQQQFKSMQKMQDHSFGKSSLLAPRNSNAQQQSHYYRQKYQEMKSINESIIPAIKLVLSQDIGEQLQKIIKQQQSVFGATPPNHKHIDLTNTFCQKMASCCSKFKSEHSLEYLSQRFVTPQKQNFQLAQMQIGSSPQFIPSPTLGKNNYRKRDMGESSFKTDSGEASTRRSSTPLKTHIATNIYCQLCEKVFPPNQFVSHTELCKYELDYEEGSDGKTSLQNSSIKVMELNYSKMMRNLLKIREEIEGQISMIASTKQEIDRVALKKKLQKDLKKVMKVINEKQQQIKRQKCSSVGNPVSKGASKRVKGK